MPRGNRELLKLGGVALPEADFESIGDLRDWMRRHTRQRLIETDLFEPATLSGPKGRSTLAQPNGLGLPPVNSPRPEGPQ